MKKPCKLSYVGMDLDIVAECRAVVEAEVDVIEVGLQITGRAVRLECLADLLDRGRRHRPGDVMQPRTRPRKAFRDARGRELVDLHQLDRVAAEVTEGGGVGKLSHLAAPGMVRAGGISPSSDVYWRARG